MARRVKLAVYARHRGVSPPAVRQAIKAQRIAVGADGLIDVRAADRAWARNTSPINGGRRAGAGRKPRGRAQTSAPVARGRAEPRAPRAAARTNGAAPPVLPVLPTQPSLEEPEAPASPAAGQGLIDAKTTREGWAAKLAELDYRHRAGELLERDEILKALGDAAREVRDGLYGIVPRVQGVLAPEQAPGDVAAVLNEEIAKALGALERRLLELAGAAAA